MAIDPAVIGREYPPVTLDIERGRLKAFAEATGQDDPIYSDLAAAQAAGHPDIPVPPTFLFGISLDGPDPFGYIVELGVDLRELLHGEESFTYHRTAYAGEQLTLTTRIADVYAKKGGALEFMVREGSIRDAAGEPVADIKEVLVVRHLDALKAAPS